MTLKEALDAIWNKPGLNNACYKACWELWGEDRIVARSRYARRRR